MLLPMVSFFLPLVLLPLVQFSNQKQEFLPMVHSCLWCCNSRCVYVITVDNRISGYDRVSNKFQHDVL